MYECPPFCMPVYRISQLDLRFKPHSDGHINFHSHADPPATSLTLPPRLLDSSHCFARVAELADAQA
jgi:hypothetical protein